MKIGADRVGAGFLYTPSSSGIKPERKLNEHSKSTYAMVSDRDDGSGTDEDADTTADGSEEKEGVVDEDPFWVFISTTTAGARWLVDPSFY